MGEDDGGAGAQQGQSPPPPKNKLQGKKVEELSHNADLRELKIFLPSGDAYLFVPPDMDEDDFELLTAVIDVHKKATNKAKAKKIRNIEEKREC